MTTTTTARQIFYSYPKLPVDAPMPEYVSLQDYEALKQERLELAETMSRIMDDYHELVAGLAKRDSDYKAALALLRQWAEISPHLYDDIQRVIGQNVVRESEKLSQLITATKAALGE